MFMDPLVDYLVIVELIHVPFELLASTSFISSCLLCLVCFVLFCFVFCVFHLLGDKLGLKFRGVMSI